MNKVGIWLAVGLVGVVLIIFIAKETGPKPAASTSSTAAAGFGSFLAGILKSSSAPQKVGAPNANPNFLGPGSSGDTGTITGNYSASQGAQYSAAMASTAEVASANAGSGGTTNGGGFSGSTTTASDPLGVGQLQNPGFDTGTMGVDFSTGF